MLKKGTLRANRTGAVAQEVQQEQEQTQVQETVQEQAQEQVNQGGQAQVATQTQANVPANVPSSAMADLNAGILEGIDDLGEGGGNYVVIDGQNWLYKSTQEEVDHIDILVTYGKKFYQWVDESDPNAKKFHDSDKQLDSRYKLKMTIKWLEDRGEGEPVEFQTTLSTTSTLNFANEYLKPLSKRGLGVGSVVTRLTVSRQVSKDGNNRFSRAEFEAFDLDAYMNGDLVPLGVKTRDAKQIKE